MQQQYAGVGRRLVATLLDTIIVYVVLVIIAQIYAAVSASAFLEAISSGMYYIATFVLTLTYYVVYQAKMGQTLGKKALGVKVVNAEGHTPSMLTFFLREYIGKLVSGLILGIGYLWPLWDKNKQALHDKIASTYVIRVNA